MRRRNLLLLALAVAAFLSLTSVLLARGVEEPASPVQAASTTARALSPASPATVGSAPEIIVLRLSPGYRGSAYSNPQ